MNVPGLAAVGEIIKIKSGILENLLKRKQKRPVKQYVSLMNSAEEFVP